MVAADELTDIADAENRGTGLTAVEMGNSDALRIGQLVCAIGTPFSQIILHLRLGERQGRTNLLSAISPTVATRITIQTDAFINPGTAAAALRREGKVIGMNTLINGIGRGSPLRFPQTFWPRSARIDRHRPRGAAVARHSHRVASQMPACASGSSASTMAWWSTRSRPTRPLSSDLRPAISSPKSMATGGERARPAKEVLRKRVGQVLQLTVWRNGPDPEKSPWPQGNSHGGRQDVASAHR